MHGVPEFVHAEGLAENVDAANSQHPQSTHAAERRYPGPFLGTWLSGLSWGLRELPLDYEGSATGMTNGSVPRGSADARSAMQPLRSPGGRAMPRHWRFGGMPRPMK